MIMENTQMHPNPRLSSLQLELLKVYSFDPSENELIEIKKILAKFFADRLSTMVDKAVEIKWITQLEIDNWLNDEPQ
jgi:hypothetical protein